MSFKGSSTSRMLDAVAGATAKAIKERRLQAITRPGEVAQLLQAYADLEHRCGASSAGADGAGAGAGAGAAAAANPSHFPC